MQMSQSPDHYLSQHNTVTHTPALNYQSIIIPLNGLDYRLTRALADLLELSIENETQASSLEFVFSETLNQVGDCFDQSHIEFINRLQGNAGEGGSVPGYPSQVYLANTPLAEPNAWSRYVGIFRYYALEIYKQLTIYTQHYPSSDFIFQKWVPNGMVFNIAPRTQIYMI